VLWRTTIDGISITADRAFVHVHDNAGAKTFSARLVVGADGAGSQVRAAANIGCKTRNYRQFALVANVTIEDIAAETAFERFTRNGPLALLPITPARHVAVRCCHESELGELLALGDAAYMHELKRGFGFRFGRFADLGRRSHHPLMLSTAERLVAPRVALVGAAANAIHPNGAQGLNLGLRDVAGLAACVKHARDNGDDIGDEACLTAYSRKRRSDSAPLFRSPMHWYSSSRVTSRCCRVCVVPP
jgi:2-octaprenyl-6-methoxyphenol hydroxylase